MKQKAHKKRHKRHRFSCRKRGPKVIHVKGFTYYRRRIPRTKNRCIRVRTKDRRKFKANSP